MATKAAQIMGPNGQHTSGIFADMTVDGPEIGTLVIIVDRAKNLPNRKSMGKQSAYCAARLGKEAKKTETDKRGGQTPKWDQELRFTVHDSPDYNNLKISVFSEDKRTDLIGEAWVSLVDLIVPGGGKNDLWQGLSCKGKYAGEIRFELTYYDTRPKPEKPHRESVSAAAEDEGMRQSMSTTSRVKRRPLPTNPNSGTVTPDTIPDAAIAMPGRAKHGPRDLGVPSRANSMPPEVVQHQEMQQPLYASHGPSYGSLAQAPLQNTPPNQYYDEPQPQYQEQDSYNDPYQQPDFLPQLPPSNRQRAPTHQRVGSRQAQPAPMPLRPHSHIGLPHSHSAPIVPLQHQEPEAYDSGLQLQTGYPETIPDLEYQHRQLRQRRTDVPPGWQDEYGDPYAQKDEDNAPPPPPMHSVSAPVVPRFPHSQQSSPVSGYEGTPPSARHHSVPNASPLQNVERRYGQPQQTPPHVRGRSVDDYASSPEHSPYGATPPSLVPGQQPSPYGRTAPARGVSSRHNTADPYANTPPRPHPLSQEVPRARSPMPPMELRGSSPLPYDQQGQYQHDYRGGVPPPLIKPRALSPRPGMPPQESSGSLPRISRNSYSIQYPVRAFESADNNPLSTSQSRGAPPPNHRTPTTRKTLTPQPSPTDGRPSGTGMPFSPDSFDIHNPHAARTTPLGTSPHTPYQSRPGAEASRQEPKGPIVGWHGQEIDPSDHLPVDSWAPEPEKKTPTKTYGLGRDRDFGPRGSQGTPPASGGRLGKDTVINVRMKSGGSASEPEVSPIKAGPNRLVKRNGGSSGGRSPIVEPLREHANYNSVPDPYAGQAEYSRGFISGQPAYGGPPGVPPKVPLQQSGHGPEYDQQGAYGYGQDALAREISSIDIGSGSGLGRHGRPTNASVPSPTAYVPVRSHRDRQSYY